MKRRCIFVSDDESGRWAISGNLFLIEQSKPFEQGLALTDDEVRALLDHAYKLGQQHWYPESYDVGDKMYEELFS